MAGALPLLPSNCEPGSSRDTQVLLRPSPRGALCAAATKGFHPMHQIHPPWGTSPCARDSAAAVVAPSAGSHTLQTAGALGTPASHRELLVRIHQIVTVQINAREPSIVSTGDVPGVGSSPTLLGQRLARLSDPATRASPRTSQRLSRSVRWEASCRIRDSGELGTYGRGIAAGSFVEPATSKEPVIFQTSEQGLPAVAVAVPAVCLARV